MSATELEPPATPPEALPTRGARSATPRRIRHEVLDGLSAAALSLGASVAVTGLIYLALWWAG